MTQGTLIMSLYLYNDTALASPVTTPSSFIDRDYSFHEGLTCCSWLWCSVHCVGQIILMLNFAILQISLQNATDTTRTLYVTSCSAQPSITDSSNTYSLISNGCPTGATTQFIPSSSTTQTVVFRFQVQYIYLLVS